MQQLKTFTDFFKTATGCAPYPWQCRLASGEPAEPARSAEFRKDTPAAPAGAACRSLLIDIPTGLGKTAGVVLAWLFNRLFAENPNRSPLGRGARRAGWVQPLGGASTVSSAERGARLVPAKQGEDGRAEWVPWPRRLVYCLPMRTLVKQIADEVEKWLQCLNAESRSGILPLSPTAKNDLTWLLEHSPVILMGGQDLSEEKKSWDLYPEKPAILIGTQDMLLSRALNRSEVTICDLKASGWKTLCKLSFHTD